MKLCVITDWVSLCSCNSGCSKRGAFLFVRNFDSSFNVLAPN